MKYVLELSAGLLEPDFLNYCSSDYRFLSSLAYFFQICQNNAQNITLHHGNSICWKV
jgi:thiaminase